MYPSYRTPDKTIQNPQSLAGYNRHAAKEGHTLNRHTRTHPVNPQCLDAVQPSSGIHVLDAMR